MSREEAAALFKHFLVFFNVGDRSWAISQNLIVGGKDADGNDMRDIQHQGTPYNGSGCLIHGLSVLADSFVAIDKLLAERPEDADKLVPALRANFEGYEELHAFLKAAPKFGNNVPVVDAEAAEVANWVSDMVTARKNYLGNPFRADWSSPTTHLTYGYWVGTTPDDRFAREQLNYGVDPLFFNPDNPAPVAPFYLYVNVTTPETLRKVLADPQKYAPLRHLHYAYPRHLRQLPGSVPGCAAGYHQAAGSGIHGYVMR